MQILFTVLLQLSCLWPQISQTIYEKKLFLAPIKSVRINHHVFAQPDIKKAISTSYIVSKAFRIVLLFKHSLPPKKDRLKKKLTF